MAKKYNPSGYQIINLDLTGKTSGTAFTPETEDEKLLYNILVNKKCNKPILLQILWGVTLLELCGFGIYYDQELSITVGEVGGSVTHTFSLSSDKLLWDLQEE